MKQYKKNNEFGYDEKDYNKIMHEVKYSLNYQRHGFYYSIYSINNINFYYTGYYNMEIEYSHWIDDYQQFNYRYFI